MTSAENTTEFDMGPQISARNQSKGAQPPFVVNLLQKKTPTGTKIGVTQFGSNYRTIEEVRIRDSNDLPDAPKISQAGRVVQKVSCAPLNNYAPGKSQIKL